MRDEKEEVCRIDGRARFLDVLFEMIQGSKEEVRMAMLYWGGRWGDKKLLDEVVFPKLKNAIENAISTGASIRVLGDSKRDDLGISRRLQELGVEVRTFEGVQFRFIVVDLSECLFAISEPYTETADFYHAVWSNNQVLIQFFKDNFESLWPISQKLQPHTRSYRQKQI